MALERKSNIAADGLVHDLNNVFQTILQAACLVSCDEQHAANADIIMRNVERARRILGMAEFGDHTPLVDIIERATEFVHDYCAVGSGPKLVVVVTVDPSILVARSAPMERVLINLFLNAVQAAGRASRSSVQVRINTRADRDFFELTVADDGPGIPKELLGANFSTQSSEPNRRIGQGLDIVQTSVRDCGGTVLAANSESGGAVFTIRLPGIFTKEPERPEPKPVPAERIAG